VSPPAPAFRIFHPLLAGATLTDRLIASGGALAGVILTAVICGYAQRAGSGLPVMIAPIGASAVLLFAVPASPLAQPWSIVGGNVISALVGVLVTGLLGHGPLAMGVAVAGAILAMSFARCLHPPGGAVAMTAVIGGPAIWASGLAFPFTLVAVNAAVIVVLGWLFHRASGHSYPHRPAPPSEAKAAGGLHHDDIRKALADAGEAFDVSEADLEVLLTRAEHYARLRAAG
jgi:CBS domain-containing membrane protein